PGDRLTPAQITQLWQRDADRVGAVFGAAGDPQRAVRIEAWGNLASARNELGAARQLLHDAQAHPGGSSRGPSPEAVAQQAVDRAEIKVRTALAHVDDLGMNVGDIDAGLNQAFAQSMLEHPRLVGGSSHGASGSGAVGTAPNSPLVAAAVTQPPPPMPDIALHGNGSSWLAGGSVRPTVGENGAVHYRVLGADGTPEPGAHVTLHSDGSFDIEHADGRGHGFDSTGGLVDESFPLHGTPDSPSSFTVLTEHHPGGPPTHTLTGGTGDEALDLLDTGGYRVTDPRSGLSTRFDLQGNFAGRDVALVDAAGNRGHYVVSTGTGHTLTDVHGNALTQLRLSAPGEGLLRLTDDVSGGSTLHGPDGRIVQTSTSLVDDLGARGTLFAVERNGTHVLTDAAGNALAGTRQVDLPAGTGVRVTDHGTGASVHYDLTGQVRERGIAVAGADGVRGDRFVVADGTGHVLTDAAGTRLGNTVHMLPDGGYRVEAPPGGARSYERFDANGTTTGHGRQLFDETGTPVGMLDTPAVTGPHPLAPAPGAQFLDDALTPGSARPATDNGLAGIRVEDPNGGHRVFDPASGRLTDQTMPLRGADGAPGTMQLTIRREAGMDPRFGAVDATGAPLPNVTVTREHGTYRFTDSGNHNSFVRHRADGTLLETGTALRGSHGVDGTFAVARETHGGGAPVWHLENADGLVPHRTVTRDADHNLRVAVDHPNTPRHGEFRDHGPNGNLRHEGFNVLKDGRRTDHQFHVDHTAQTPSWRQGFHPDVTPPTGTRPSPTGFQHGTVDLSGAANGRIRLQSATKGKVDVFERRLLPDGTALDAFRRTDLTGFGNTSRRTTWVQWDHGGVALSSGTRRFDTSGFGWTDVNSRGQVVREYRDSIQKYGTATGHTVGVKAGDGNWTWHRYDGAGHQLAEGPRTVHVDGGWSDRLAPGGAPVQRQWGTLHTPDNARHYFEHTVDAAGVPQPSWAKQSPQGKESGKHTQTAPDSSFTVERLSEQRPPKWVRDRWIKGAGEPGGAHAHLGSDNRYQLFSWHKESAGTHTSGTRFVGDDGSWVDILADGGFVRSETKLHGGTTLKVGDNATPPAGAPHVDAHVDARPWSDGTNSGFRVETTGGGGGAIWQDRRFVPGRADGVAGHWEVVREGFPNGSIREHLSPPHVNATTGDIPGRHVTTWIQRDGHGYPVGHAQNWPDGAGGSVRIVAEGGADAKSWQWQAIDADGTVTAHGRRDLFRSSSDPRLPFDDSFRDFDAAGNLVRDKRMLDGGSYVDSWHVADPTPGGTGPGTWQWEKYGRNGVAQPHGGAGAGAQTRTWWDPNGATNGNPGAWELNPVGTKNKNLMFRDEFRAPGDAHPTVVRETPPHLAGSAPDRIRQYHSGNTADPPAAGTWTEFDHGAAVRTRTASGNTFLEHDAWRGQWRKYDADGNLLARRTDSGLVFERDSLGRWQMTGTENDFRGPLTELRGWGRRLREGQRMPWTGAETGIDVSQFRAALTNLPGVDTTRPGVLRLAEAGYQPYWKVVAKKAALEFAQEFAIEFAANLLANGINAAINNKQFTWQDVGKAAANAAVGSAVKTTVGTFVHENKFDSMRWTGERKAGLANIDGGKHLNRRPGNHDKTWANEWAGNETPTRWRSGTYDFFVGGGIGGLAGWVNGSMNAAVWGVKDGNGVTHTLSGWDAFLDGGISALSGTLSAGSIALGRNLVMSGAGGRFFHRQGFADFWLNIGFKTGEKLFNSWLQSTLRGNFNPFWY
ncbi:hypothetical protein, partial [Streptomyces sp. SID3343]|uniref:hypothetical protein n=1 Tax=Streptomyces sp. SID3343 TaxID=2690260 RepID=UPI001368A4D1